MQSSAHFMYISWTPLHWTSCSSRPDDRQAQAYIPSWWYFQPSLVRVGDACPPPFHSIYPLDSSCIAPSDPLPSKTSEFYLYAPPYPSPFSLVRLKNTVSQMGCTSLLYSSSLHILCYLHKRTVTSHQYTTSSILIAASFFQFLVLEIPFHPSTLTEISQVISRYAHYISQCIQ